jgi:ribokinase
VGVAFAGIVVHAGDPFLMNQPPQIVIVGGCAIDYALRAEHLPSPGQSVNGDVFLRNAGGKGLNQPVGVVRLGALAVLIAAIGQDREGDDVLRALEQNGIGTDRIVRVEDVPTACTLICVDAQGRKQTASRPGANMALSERRLPGEFLTCATVLLTQLEIPVPTVLEAARLARRGGATVILDAAPATTIPDELIMLAGVVTANGAEARALSGIAVDNRESAVIAARAIRRRGARAVAVAAPDGRAVVTDTDEQWLPNHQVPTIRYNRCGGCLRSRDRRESRRRAVVRGSLCVRTCGRCTRNYAYGRTGFAPAPSRRRSTAQSVGCGLPDDASGGQHAASV